MSYNFVSDFWKINLLGKAVFFNQDQIVYSSTGEELIVGPEDCLFVHNYCNEKNPIKPRPKGFLNASLIRKTPEKDEIVDIELPCEFIRDYHTLETNQVFQFIDRIKKEYFESNERLVSHNLKMIKSELAIDKQFMSSDFAGLKKSLEGINKDQEQLHEIFSEYASANVELVNVLLLEQRIMQSLILKNQIQKNYFDENFKFGLDLQEIQTQMFETSFARNGIFILDHLIAIEPFLCQKLKIFEFEKLTFEATIQMFIAKMQSEGPGWFPKSFIGLFSSIYFKNKYAYIFSDGTKASYILVDSNSLLALPKHKQIISNGSFRRISLNAGSLIRQFSRLVDSFEDYQVSNLAHFIIVLQKVTCLDLPTLLKEIKIHELGLKLDEVPDIEHRLDLSESFEHKAIVALRQIIAAKDKIGLFDLIDQHTGKDKLYSTYANNQLKLNINGHLLVTNQNGFVDGVIKKVPGYGNVLCVEIRTISKRLELKIPIDFLEKAERDTLRSMCIPIVNKQDQQYIHQLYHSYQYLAQDASNFEMYHLAMKSLDESKLHHQNFVKTLITYFETECGQDTSTPEFAVHIDKVTNSLLSIFGYTKLQMIRPNMVHLKIWQEVVEQIKVIVDVHSNSLHQVNELCKANQITPISLCHSTSNEFLLIAEAKTKDDRICQSEWVDLYKVDPETKAVSFMSTTVEMPDGWVRIYDWVEHNFITKTRPVLFRGKEQKQQFIASLNKMPDWYDDLDARQKFDLTTFRKIFNKVDRCVEYMLVTADLDIGIGIFKPYKMYMEGHTVMVEGHYYSDFGELLYASAPDQNAREDVIQMLITYLQPKYPDTAIDKILKIVARAESFTGKPDEMAQVRPKEILPELSALPIQEVPTNSESLFEIIQVPLKQDMLTLEKNHNVYLGDIWAKPE